MKNYFYIIKRDGHIIEIENIGNRFISSLEQFQKGGMVVFANLGMAINTVDISDILNEEGYEGYIDSAQPKQFIKNGAWFDLKDRTKPIRYEKWRELELEEKKKLRIEAPEVSQEEVNALLKKYRPNFENRNKEIIPPHDPDLTANAKVLTQY